MEPRPLARALLLWACMTSAVAAQQRPPAVAYAVSVSLRLAPAAAAASFVHDGMTLDAPSNPRATIAIGDQALFAYARLTRRLFLDGGTAPAATLTVEAVAGGLPAGLGGWRARVTHTVSLTSPEGQELGRWTVTGEAPLAGGGAGALPVAFSGAAREAATALERALEERPEVLAWLAAHGVSRRTDLPAPAVSRPAETRPASYRAGRVLFVEAILGGSADTDEVPNANRFGLDSPGYLALAGLRFGGSGQTLVWQVSAVSWSRARRGNGGYAERYDLTVFGADLGAVRRLGDNLEFQGGAGLQGCVLRARNVQHLFWVPDPDAETFRLQPALFAGVRSLFGLGRGGLLARVGLEGRASFDNRYRIASLYGNYRTPAWSVSFVAGVEWPSTFGSSR